MPRSSGEDMTDTRASDANGALSLAQVPCDARDAVAAISAQLGPGPFELVCFFVSPQADFAALNRAFTGAFGKADVYARVFVGGSVASYVLTCDGGSLAAAPNGTAVHFITTAKSLASQAPVQRLRS